MKLQIIWLRHYLLGSGKDLRVPDRYCYGALSVFKKALDTGGHVEHSMYQGSSFFEKPSFWQLRRYLEMSILYRLLSLELAINFGSDL